METAPHLYFGPSWRSPSVSVRWEGYVLSDTAGDRRRAPETLSILTGRDGPQVTTSCGELTFRRLCKRPTVASTCSTRGVHKNSFVKSQGEALFAVNLPVHSPSSSTFPRIVSTISSLCMMRTLPPQS